MTINPFIYACKHARDRVIIHQVPWLPIFHSEKTYCKWEFCWAKLSQYSHYMDFSGNTIAMQDQGTYMLYLEQKIHGKNFCTLLKTMKTAKV